MIETRRLLLRRWRDDDRPSFAALNADPEVMQHLPSTLTRVQSDALVDRIECHFDEHRYGWWALQLRETGNFIGCAGLMQQTFDAHFTPAVEVGWRLQRSAWGNGYATEAARASIAYGFSTAGLVEIVSMTAPDNTRSRRVMERAGMRRDPADDFDHPNLLPDSPLRRHVLYRITPDQAGEDR